ncbi:MAG: DsbE family thiol:disulfide interchange protein [Alphaproteobacteria bacterium]|jgi:cytochrome c biogenesis protein CcmG/thiol:disulfide interchange protein DsbE|nr:DsbE family thiol:disulfide interchange protein [Alphaproteobacteria bacterium]MDP6566953.1 DsbE family thiol:disulfide interchange protein [Alphaproteobacteria bacterium]MDP6813753.1 DsbE family thiol:disulfide interchange protein [Alphaproteobacteria bacterium]
MSEVSQREPDPAAPRRPWLRLLPLLLAMAIGAFLFVGLGLKPKEIPSALIGKAVPAFDLPALPERPPGLKSADLQGQVSLVNVFASWCLSCRVEHPLFMNLKALDVVPVHGLNYKDEPQAALAWLDRYGDPYQRIGADRKGRVGIDWGVYGVPETFLINAQGRIACKHIGPVSDSDLQDKLLPAIEALRQGKEPKC